MDRMKKKPSQTEIDTFYDKLACKVFDIYEFENKKYYLDRDLNLIWDTELEAVGIINKNKYVFFQKQNEIDNIVTECKNTIL